jgi:hypothetical protein
MPKGYRKDGTPIRPPSAGKGRTSQNTTLKDVKAMIYAALKGLGGEEWLKKQAKEYPAAFFGLVGRLVPIQSDVTLGGQLGVISDKPITADEWAAQAQTDLESTERPPAPADHLSH